MGALIEHCFTTMHTGKASWEGVFEAIRKAGPERCVLSTDLGQTINPPVAEGFANGQPVTKRAVECNREPSRCLIVSSRLWCRQ